MATTSTLVDVETALLSLLRSRAWNRHVVIDAAVPGEDRLERDHIYLGDSRGRQDDAAMKAGRRWRNESYSLDVVVWTLRPGGTPADAKTAAVELWGGVDDILADYPTLGLDAVTGAEIGDWAVSAVSQPNGAACQIVLSVDVTARLI